jgi:hypothetical protein
MKAKKVQLKEENIQLYGKIKFLQSDLSKRSAAVPSASSSGHDYHYGNNNNLEKRKSYYSEDSRYNDDQDNNNNMNNSHDIEAKYEQLYEQRINPFAAVREVQEKEKHLINN